MIRNFPGQSIGLYAYDATTLLPKTGDAANIAGSWNPEWVGVFPLASPTPNEIDAVNAAGWYQFDVAQIETDEDVVLFTAISSTPGVLVQAQLITLTPPDFTNNLWDQMQVDHVTAGTMAQYLIDMIAILQQFGFTVAGKVDANTQAVNDLSLKGTGVAGDSWRPA